MKAELVNLNPRIYENFKRQLLPDVRRNHPVSTGNLKLTFLIETVLVHVTIGSLAPILGYG